MKFEVFKKAIPKECLNAFIEKQTRYDGRTFEQNKEFIFTPKVFDSFQFSAIGSLGLNKIIFVLKENDTQEGKNSLSINIENFETNDQRKINLIDDYVKKISTDNFLFKKDNKKYELFIIIESVDGNVYDAIGMTFVEFFKRGRCDIELKKSFLTKTISVIDEEILFDPSKDEEKLADFTFNIIKFTDETFFIHKIKGDFLEWDQIKKIINKIN